MIPQIIVLGLTFLGIGSQMVKHGKPKEGNESFWTHLIAVIITYSLLYWGGFFDSML